MKRNVNALLVTLAASAAVSHRLVFFCVLVFLFVILIAAVIKFVFALTISDFHDAITGGVLLFFRLSICASFLLLFNNDPIAINFIYSFDYLSKDHCVPPVLRPDHRRQNRIVLGLGVGLDQGQGQGRQIGHTPVVGPGFSHPIAEPHPANFTLAVSIQ